MKLVGVPEAGVSELIQLYTKYLAIQRCHKPSTYSPFACILFILLFLCYYPALLFISTIFEIHTSTAQQLAHKMLGFLYNLLSPCLTFQSRNFCFHHAQNILGRLVTYALNGAEQPVCGLCFLFRGCSTGKANNLQLKWIPPPPKGVADLVCLISLVRSAKNVLQLTPRQRHVVLVPLIPYNISRGRQGTLKNKKTHTPWLY